MKDLLIALCNDLDKQFSTNVSEHINDNHEYKYTESDPELYKLTEIMVQNWDINTQIIQGFLIGEPMSGDRYADNVGIAGSFVHHSDSCEATQKDIRRLIHSLRSNEIQKNLNETNYWKAIHRVWQLADFGVPSKYRIESTSIKEPYNFQISVVSKITLVINGKHGDIARCTLTLNYTHGKLNLIFNSQEGCAIHLLNKEEILETIIKEFDIRHFSTGF